MGLVAASEVLLAGGFLCLLCMWCVRSLLPAANAEEKVIPQPIFFQREGKKAEYYF